MFDATERLIHMTKEAELLKDHSDIVMKQFQVAASRDNREEMDKARLAAHEFLDQIFDLLQELASLQNEYINDTINRLKDQG